jgi:heparanase
VRQSLSGASYGLLNEDTLEPRPDYWASVLWKRLMGTRVLDARTSGGAMVRAYAHCARDRSGEAVALVLNLDPGETVQLDQGKEAWVVTADALASQTLKLNGKPIALEQLEPGPGAPRLPPRSWAFVRLGAVSACD